MACFHVKGGTDMETFISICVGIGLSAASGFRVFVPLLFMSVASHAGHLTLSPGFERIGTSPALAAFAIATALEIAAYSVPWVDNLLDTVATPAAILAGIIVTASAVSGMSPFLQWALAISAGGGVAGTIHVATGIARGASTVTTAGFGNPILATAEAGGAIVLSLLSLVVPVIAAIAVLLILYYGVKKVSGRARGHCPRARAGEEPAA